MGKRKRAKEPPVDFSPYRFTGKQPFHVSAYEKRVRSNGKGYLEFQHITITTPPRKPRKRSRA